MPEVETDLAAEVAMLEEQITEKTAELSHLKTYIAQQASWYAMDAAPRPREGAIEEAEALAAELPRLRQTLQKKHRQLSEVSGPTAWEKFQQRRQQEKDWANQLIDRVNRLGG